MAKLDISPETDMIDGMIQRSATLREMLSELFDNPFDWGATKVELLLTENGFTLEDNGIGIADWKALLKLGRKHRDVTNRLGRWGWGFKNAAVWLAESVDIETRHNNARAFTRIDWTAIRESHDWTCDVGDPQHDPGPSYTRFDFHGIRGKKLKNLPAVAKDLAYRYTPALKNGAEIIIDGQRLEPVDLPPFASEPLTIDRYFNDTLHYRLIAGVKADHSEPERKGYDVAYKHRIVRQRDLTGFQKYSAQRFYGYLELLNDGEEDWDLAQHKDEFGERDDLYQELFEFIRPILEEAANAHEQMEFRDLQRMVIENVNKIASGKKEQRDPGDTVGTHSRTGTGKKRQSKKEQDDPENKLKRKIHGRGVHVAFDCQTPNLIGEVQDGRHSIVVSLNPEFPIIRSKNAEAVTAIVCSLLTLDAQWMDSYRQLFLEGMEANDAKPTVADFSELVLRAMPFDTAENKEDAA
jgi:hypothetical protein